MQKEIKRLYSLFDIYVYEWGQLVPRELFTSPTVAALQHSLLTTSASIHFITLKVTGRFLGIFPGPGPE